MKEKESKLELILNEFKDLQEKYNELDRNNFNKNSDLLEENSKLQNSEKALKNELEKTRTDIENMKKALLESNSYFFL